MLLQEQRGDHSAGQTHVCVCVGGGMAIGHSLTCAVGVIALPALGPVTPALGSPVGSSRALARPLLRPVGTGH